MRPPAKLWIWSCVYGNHRPRNATDRRPFHPNPQPALTSQDGCGPITNRLVAHNATRATRGLDRTMNPVQALLRGLHALDLVRASADPVRATDVAARLHMDKGSASRTLHTLAQAGYLSQTSDRRFVPGSKMLPAQAPQLVEIV